MGNHRLYNAERIHALGTPESERLKVTALNLFHPTAPPLLQELFLFVVTQSHGQEGGSFSPVLLRVPSESQEGRNR